MLVSYTCKKAQTRTPACHRAVSMLPTNFIVAKLRCDLEISINKIISISFVDLDIVDSIPIRPNEEENRIFGFTLSYNITIIRNIFWFFFISILLGTYFLCFFIIFASEIPLGMEAL
uniref:Uncharacterized protein n=1 Tax=Cacopsylla melanoneura TaxID=428564 RepID=A0A8D9DV43_9HEMI